MFQNNCNEAYGEHVAYGEQRFDWMQELDIKI